MHASKGRSISLKVVVAAALLTWCTVSLARLYAIDYMELATVLTYDGEYDKAREALGEIQPNDASYDLSKILAIEALIYNGEGKKEQAVEKFREAITATRVKKFIFDKDVNSEYIRKQDLKLLNQQLAEVLYSIDRCDEMLDALLAAQEKAFEKPQLYAKRADCLWRTGRPDMATEMLNNGYQKFPEVVALIKQKFSYFAESGLYTAASDVASELLNTDGLTESDYLSFARVFDGSGQSNQAIDLLQQARARFPGNPQFPLFIGHIYLRQGNLLTAAGLFEQAAQIDSDYYAEAAEIYRRAGMLPTALRFNSFVTDEKRKASQLLAIYIAVEEFEKVTAIEQDLQRQGMLGDDKIRYAVAYANFRTGDFRAAENHLKRIDGPDFFEQVVAIRRSIAACEKDVAYCE